MADTANEHLDENLSADEDALWANHAAATEDYADFAEDLHEEFDDFMNAVHDDFTEAVAAEVEDKEGFAEGEIEAWAYWLKYIYGFQGYDSAVYADYDDTANYGAGYDSQNYAGADGDYLDLGYQGAANNQGGFPHLSGYGYGGVGGHDYLYSGDHTGLAYGTEIGPDSDYFDGSILDPVEHSYDMSGYSYYSGLAATYDE